MQYQSSSLFGAIKRALMLMFAFAALVLLASGISRADGTFRDDFSSSTLASEWQVMQFGNAYSLTENPGFLRYHAEGYTIYSGGWRSNYDNSNWDPSTTLIRPFDGDRWLMRIKANYSLHGYSGASNSTGAQWVSIWVPFGSGVNDYVQLYRGCDWWYSANVLGAGLNSGANSNSQEVVGSTVGADGWYHDSCWWQVERDGNNLRVSASTDGVNFQQFVTGQISNLVGTANRVIIDGSAYLPYGSYADIDYIEVKNLADETAPVSAVSPLPSTVKTSKFPVKWSGTDAGSGIKDYTIYVSKDGAAYTAWLTDTALTTASYTGVGGHTYRFYSRARDNSGNVEDAPSVADATTQVLLCPDKLAISPNLVAGGLKATGTVTLTGPAPDGGSVVSLSSQSPATVPPTVTVPAGETSATFIVGTSPVSAKTSANVSATLSGVSKQALITIRPVGVKSLGLSPSKITGGNNLVGVVTLEAPAGPGDVVVALSSTNASVANPLTATITVPAGSTSAAFTIHASPVSANTTVTIKALANDVGKTANLTVQAPIITSLSLLPSTVVGGENAFGVVQLDGVAGPAGRVVTLSTGNPGVAVPAGSTLVIPEGANIGYFAISTSPVALTTQVTLTAIAGITAKSVKLTVTP